MLLVYLLIIAVVVLLAFSLSRETGKNTKHARKEANAMAQHRVVASPLSIPNVSEVN
jgi:hypothetical protein